jgi:hypothetical protein
MRLDKWTSLFEELFVCVRQNRRNPNTAISMARKRSSISFILSTIVLCGKNSRETEWADSIEIERHGQ